MRRIALAATTAFPLLATTDLSLAHFSPAEHGSLLAGLPHPASGADHILALLSMGVWAVLVGWLARRLVSSRRSK